MTMFAFSSLFGSSDSINNVNDFINDVINPYLILLPYFLVIPINKIFEGLISVPTRYQNKEKIPKWVKIKKYIGIGIGVLSAFGCIFIIYILAANKSKEQNDSWMYDFSWMVFQDFFFTPLIFILLQILCIKYAYKQPK